VSFHDSLKPIAGTFLLAVYLPVPFYMLWIHAFDRAWKRMGRASYILHWSLYAAMIAAIIRFHGVWPWRAWGWPLWMSWSGVLPLAAAVYLAYRTYASIEPRTLLAFRQIRPDSNRKLIRHGILGTVRHPRYTMYALLALGNVLITGYPLVLASLAVTIATLLAAIRLEEKELARYFGNEFEEYRRTVPAFLPRLYRRGGA
jgi:protein-S-isoprenylcysteine O-methyltransferase Ste14